MIRKIFTFLVISIAGLLPAQSPSPRYQSAHILEVKEHQGPLPDKTADPSLTRYDISLRVKDTEFVVLYTPAPGTHGFQYLAGMDRLVLVKTNTITFNDLLGRSITVPIISQRPYAPPPKQ